MSEINVLKSNSFLSKKYFYLIKRYCQNIFKNKYLYFVKNKMFISSKLT